MKPTRVQSHIMGRMADGAALCPYGARLGLWEVGSGITRVVPRRTFDAMNRRGWLVSIQFPGSRPLWFLTDVGRGALTR